MGQNQSSKYGEDVELQRTNSAIVRRDLEKEFKQYFNEHGRRGVPIGEIRDEIGRRGLSSSIPQDRFDELLQRADRDSDMFLNFDEFLNMMARASESERSALSKTIGVAIENIVPLRMRQDFLANYTCCPPPLFMLLISIAEIIVFVVYAGELAEKGDPVTATSGVPMYSPLIYKPRRRYEAWRFITYMFIHQGYLHILFNLIFQLLLGLPLEMVHKWWRILVIYLLGVLAGSLAHSVTDPGIALAGASGGCYALIGAHIAAVITNWKEMNYKCWDGNFCRMLLSAPVRLIIFVSLAGADTGMAIYRRYFEEIEHRIGISAHIGGLMAGLLLGVPVLRNINELPWEKTLGWVTLAIYLAGVLVAVLFNGLYKGYPLTDWSPCCP
ncbi:rhomboid-related protein 2-like [Liolophura sinensis]|uniref:rhomboid-related protein 2-like n=1 Tax=Liolophura sinensis TaxID=3198878 RepID=UPI0031582EBB